MGTIAFLTIALILLFGRYSKVSLLMFVLMAYDYMRLLPANIMGLNGIDGAFVYMVVVSALHFLKRRKGLSEDPVLKRRVIVFTLFLGLSVFFSLFHYQLTTAQVFMGSRLHFIIFAYFFLRSIPAEETLWVLKILFYLTFAHAGIYILQFLTGLPLLGVNPVLDAHTGAYRFLNFPPLNIFFLFLALFYPHYLGKRIPEWSFVVFFVSQLCTLGRTSTIAAIFVMVISLLDPKGLSKIQNKGIILALGGIILIALPFYGMIATRLDNGGSTMNDISGAVSGDAVEMALRGESGVGGDKTFTYRLAWIAERAIYMLNSSPAEAAFGLGFYAPKDNTLAYKAYHFKIGLPAEDGHVSQLVTPDISYGNILTQFGFLGGFIYLLIWLRIFRINQSRRAEQPLARTLALFLLYYFMESFAGTNLSLVAHIIVPIMVTHFVLSQKETA